jgi:hypothetical protein
VGDDQILKDGGANRSACTECQRRKQKVCRFLKLLPPPRP